MKAMKYRRRHAHEKGTEVTQKDPQPKAIIRSTRVSRTILTASTLGLALSGAASPAAAQTKPTETLPAISVEGQGATPGDYKVDRSASAKRPAPLVDTPQSITVIPRAVIQEQNATTLRDVLRNSPGITFAAGEGGNQGEQLRIRGFAASTDLFLDGMRDFAVLNNRDPFNIEQVEVVKGASSVYSGRGATGGSIGQFSKTPNLKKSLEGAATVGTNGMRRVTADANLPLAEYGLNGAALRLNAMAHTSDGSGRDEVENKRWGFAPSLALGLNGPTRVTLSYLHEKHNNVPDYGLPTLNQVVAPVSYSNWYGIKGVDVEDQKRDIGTLLVEHDLNDSVTLRNQTRVSKSERLVLVSRPRFATTVTSFTPTTSVTRSYTGNDSENTQYINQTDATIKFKTGSLEHTVVAGMELSREDYRRRTVEAAGTIPTTRLHAPTPDVSGVYRRYTGARVEATGDTLAFYGFDTVKLSEQWEASVGLRWDRFSADTNSVTAAGVATPFSRTDTLTSWNAALVYKPAKNGSVYVAASTSYNPSAESMTAALTSTTAATEPQKNVTYEIGTKWDLFGEKLGLTAALFRTDKTNVRDTDSSGNSVILGGERRAQGLELGATGKLTDQWSVFAGYTYIDSEVTKALQYVGNQLANTARHSASLWTTYETPWELKIGGGVQYVGARYMTDANIGKMGAYTVFDAMASYPVTEHVEVQLNGYNLFDKQYLDKAHGGGGHVIPGAGRTVLLSTNFKF